MIAIVIICCALVFCTLLFWFIIKSAKQRDSLTGKTSYDFSSMKPSFILSRLLWSLIGTIAMIYIFSLAFVVLWAFISSFRDEISFTWKPLAWPDKWLFSNYVVMLEKLEIKQSGYTYGIADMLINSVIYAVISPLVGLFWQAIVAYVMSRFVFPGNKFLFNLGIVIMMVPIVGNLAASMAIQQRWGLYDNMYVKLFIPPATAFSGLDFMILYGALKILPQDFSEAAYIDGASEYGVMFKIILPMIIPTCAVLYVLGFMASWNAYEVFLIWYPSTPNLAYGMFKFQSGSTKGSSPLTIPQILAGFIFAMLPSMVLYLCSQKLISSKFTVGGLKG